MTYTTQQFTIDELASRGLNDKGDWVGFERAKQIHHV